MKKIWNIVSTSGAILNKTPIHGTKEQAEAYMDILFKFCELAEVHPFDLDQMEIEKEGDMYHMTCGIEHVLTFQILNRQVHRFNRSTMFREGWMYNVDFNQFECFSDFFHEYKQENP